MQKRDATSKKMLEAAVCYSVALQLGLAPKENPDAPTEVVEELTQTLEGLGVENSADKAYEILSYACAANDYKQKHPIVLSVTKYDAQRVKILRDLRLRSARGLQLWPPTSQTIITRLGGRWSEAMESCGLESTAGVSIGHANIRFTAEDHFAAIRKYAAERKAQHKLPSYAGYVTWAREQDPRVPSGALLREIYRSWPAALEAAGVETE